MAVEALATDLKLTRMPSLTQAVAGLEAGLEEGMEVPGSTRQCYPPLSPSLTMQ